MRILKHVVCELGLRGQQNTALDFCPILLNIYFSYGKFIKIIQLDLFIC